MAQQKTAQDYLQSAGKVSMEYLNIFKTKLTNTVVDTVYMAENITKTVLPGNPVTREYEVTKHIGSAGPGLLWKLYAGYKKSTKQEATVFVLNKKNLENYSKKNRDLIVDAFKKGATQLARIKHPRILSLQHQLEESKDSLAFATEPCFCSLANVLGNHENMPTPLPDEFSSYKLFEVEIKYGLMQVAEGLSFLHKDVKMLHRNICPESIIINSNGAWKIAGFELFATNINDPNDALKFPFKEWDGSIASILNQPLEYLAPEYGLSSKCDLSSDIFSYGMLFYAVFNNGKTLYHCDSNYSIFVNNVEELKRLTNSKFGSIPDEVREYLKLLMHINPELRPDAGQIMKIPFFDDVAVKTLEYLDSSFQVDNLQKSIFFKSLPQIIDKLPLRVSLQRIIPCLEQEFINPDMIPFLLPNMFLIAEQANNEEYVKYILPRLKLIFKLQKPIQILLIVLRNMNLILSKTPSTDIKEHILPMVCRSLEAETTEIQELCLSTLPSFANLLDTQSIKHQLIPRIRKICLESSTISVRVNSLVCIGKLLENLEKWIVLDDILPILEKITIRDSAILMAMLGIYKIVLTHPKLGITKDLLATRVLPFLIPITIDNNLNMSQFNSYISLIKEMLNQIESEQRKKLEQIEAMEREKAIIPYSIANVGSTKPKEVQRAPDSMMDKLMIGYGVTNQNNMPPPGYENTNLVLNSQAPTAKKELSLNDKIELASKLESSAPSESNQKHLSNSFSMGSINSAKHSVNKKNIADNLLESNLAELSVQNKPTNNNNINKPFNQNMFTNQMSNYQTPSNQTQQMGFFGNLALPAPPSSQQQQMQHKINTPPLIAPPPSLNNMNLMKPLSGPNQTNQSKTNSIQSNKTAFDDLADIFG